MAHTGKIVNLKQLEQLRAAAAEGGQVVVHCHGCFDIVHPGHIHHLQHARTLGDLLVVTVSSDSNVAKGVNRPLIPEDLRAASLAALQSVDYVYINPEPTAVSLLNRLKPDVYVKGLEYEHSQDPRFLAERDAVITGGGRVVFTGGEIVYSSTALIGQLRESGAFRDEKVLRCCHRHDIHPASIGQMLQRFAGKRVLVVGDYVQDRYHFCEASGIAGEGPMVNLRSFERRDYDGGAAVIARHVHALGASAHLITTLADDEPSAEVDMRLRADGIELDAPRQRRMLAVKHRFLADETKLFKVDEGGFSPLDSAAEDRLAELIINAAAAADAVIFADFGLGLLTSRLVGRVLPAIRRPGLTITADVSGQTADLAKFRGVGLLCPTEREMRSAFNEHAAGLGAVAARMLHALQVPRALVTLGKQGLVAASWPEGDTASERLESEYLPSLCDQARDPLGCGDALLAAATLTLAAGGSLPFAAFMGSVAAAIEAQQVGNIPVSDSDVQDFAGRLAHSGQPLRLVG
ncbi:MAG: PfkB family carbohydrate kinase [Phycisphaerae bacterium]